MSNRRIRFQNQGMSGVRDRRQSIIIMSKLQLDIQRTVSGLHFQQCIRIHITFQNMQHITYKTSICPKDFRCHKRIRPSHILFDDLLDYIDLISQIDLFINVRRQKQEPYRVARFEKSGRNNACLAVKCDTYNLNETDAHFRYRSMQFETHDFQLSE